MPKKILFVHAGAEMYGADKILLELVRGLSNANFACYVVVPNEGPLVEHLRAAGANVVSYELGVLRRKYFSLFGLLNRVYFLAAAILFIRRICKQQGIDIIHTNTSAVLSGALAARTMSIRHIWHIHEIIVSPNFLAKFLANMAFYFSSDVICVSKAVEARLIELKPALKGKTHVIYNGINFPVNVDSNFRIEQGISSSAVLIGMVGRVNSWKGQDRLLQAFRLLKMRRPELDVHLVLIGGTFDGEEDILIKLKKLIRESGIDSNVTVCGFRNDIAGVLSCFDIFVLPSTNPDPFPTVVLEAMHAGKPVVAFAHGGVVEMVSKECGFLEPVEDVVALSTALERLSSDAHMRSYMGEAARRRVNELFSSFQFLNKFIMLYQS